MSKEDKDLDLFSELNEPRRRRIVEESSSVANMYSATQTENKIKEKAIDSILTKSKTKKDSFNYYLDIRVDAFLSGMHAITGNSKSEILNTLMTILIQDSDVVKSMATQNKKIEKLVDRFNESN